MLKNYSLYDNHIKKKNVNYIKILKYIKFVTKDYEKRASRKLVAHNLFLVCNYY